MGRDEAPADVQWARALTAVAIAFAMASWQLYQLHFCCGVN
jgi:hypothetical protein